MHSSAPRYHAGDLWQKPTFKLAVSALKYCDWMKVPAASLQVGFCNKWKRRLRLGNLLAYWVVPEKIHTPPKEEIPAVRRRRGEKIVSDNSKCIRTSHGGRGVNFLFPP